MSSKTQQLTFKKKTMGKLDLDLRSQNSYTAPCNGIINHGASVGGILIFASFTCGNKHKKNVSKIFVCRAAFYTYLSSCLHCAGCRWHMQLTNQDYFDCRKNLNIPNWSPMQEGKWCRILNLRSKSVGRMQVEQERNIQDNQESWKGSLFLSIVSHYSSGCHFDGHIGPNGGWVLGHSGYFSFFCCCKFCPI